MSFVVSYRSQIKREGHKPSPKHIQQFFRLEPYCEISTVSAWGTLSEVVVARCCLKIDAENVVLFISDIIYPEGHSIFLGGIAEGDVCVKVPVGVLPDILKALLVIVSAEPLIINIGAIDVQSQLITIKETSFVIARDIEIYVWSRYRSISG
jgi:hypothetical protein